MSLAPLGLLRMEMLDEESFAKLDVKALAWEGSRSEKDPWQEVDFLPNPR